MGLSRHSQSATTIGEPTDLIAPQAAGYLSAGARALKYCAPTEGAQLAGLRLWLPPAIRPGEFRYPTHSGDGCFTYALGSFRPRAAVDHRMGVSWSYLLNRACATNVEPPKCGGQVRVIACIEEPPLIAKALRQVQQREALNHPLTRRSRSARRRVKQRSWFFSWTRRKHFSLITAQLPASCRIQRCDGTGRCPPASARWGR
jgi:hypothetical protein